MANDVVRYQEDDEPVVTASRALAEYERRDGLVRRAAAAIAQKAWGKALTEYERAAVARYCIEANLDPARHVHVLGGNIYVNAEAYMDKLAADPHFEAVEFIDIADNEDERRRWRVPEYALAAYIVEIRHAGRMIREVGYAPKRANDDVGKQFPGEKARASGVRRAARFIIPIWSRRLDQMARAFDLLHVQAKAVRDTPYAELPAPIDVEAEPDAPPGEAGAKCDERTVAKIRDAIELLGDEDVRLQTEALLEHGITQDEADAMLRSLMARVDERIVELEAEGD